MRILSFIILFFVFNTVFSQYYKTMVKGKSEVKKISYRTETPELNPYTQPKLEIKEFNIIDKNLNRVLERDETVNIEFVLENNGPGTARDIYLKMESLNKSIEGLEFQSEYLVGNIYSKDARQIIIPVKGKENLNTGIAHFSINVSERFGNNIEPFNVKIGTHEYQQPDISINKVVFSTDNGGKAKLGYPVYLKLYIENISPKAVKNLEVDVGFENPGCVLLEDSKFIISSLESKQTVVKELIFTAKKNYPYDVIPIKLHFHDQYVMYSEKRNIMFDLNLETAKRNPYEIEELSSPRTNYFIADIDTSIPVDSILYKNRYALIIGNEDYTKFQPSLATESNVIYAKNDATIFSKYAHQTLGIPEENIFVLINATYAEMNHEIERMSMILEKTGEEAELIFYYAGHGLPDENSRSPYLIPVDVAATNLNSAIKLSSIYKRFSESGAKMVTMFVDACFTGGGRESGLMAARAFSVEPNYDLIIGNIVVFTASSGTQSSLPYHDKRHGIFTYFLLKKIKETKGYISYGELSDYLTKKVSIESLRVNAKEQDPKVNISTDLKNDWQNWSFKGKK